MKVVCDRAALLDAVNLVAAVVPARTPSPQLSCVKLTATKTAGGAGELTLAGTDAETSLEISVSQVDVTKAGQAAVPADKLRGIVSAEEGEPTLSLEVEGDACHIRGTGAHFRVYGYPASEFPPIPNFQQVLSGEGTERPRTVFAQSAAATMALVARTVFATARETSRYAINGVLLKRDGKKLEMVATDGRRLAVSRGTLAGPADKGGGEPVMCIIPTKALGLLQKLVRDPEEIVRVAITDSRIYFAFEPAIEGGKGKEKGPTPARAVLSSTLVEGTFPPYEDVIPKEQDKKVVADRESLIRAVRKASVLTNEESRGVRMAFSGTEKKLTLSSRAPEMGEAEIEVDLASYDGENIDISFNPAFLSDVLKVVEDQQVVVELKAPNKPGLVRSSTNDFLYVIMPVNLPQ